MTQKVPGTLLHEWTLITGNTPAVRGMQYLCNTTAGSFTVTLPSSPIINDTVSIADYAGTFATNKLIVAPAGSDSIMGTTGGEVMDVQTNNISFTLLYSGNATYGWRII